MDKYSTVSDAFYSEDVFFPVLDECSFSPVVYMYKNKSGKDFVVGDIHGEFDKLEKQLAEISFDKQRDRLFSVGDMVDRGKGSHQVSEYLQQDWFFAVSGNHEDMILTALSKPVYKYLAICADNGGIWVFRNREFLNEFKSYATADLGDLEREKVFDKLMSHHAQARQLYISLYNLPYVIQIEDFAILHAEVTNDIHNWSDFIEDVSDLSIDALSACLWGTARYDYYQIQPVKGIKQIYCGHRIVSKPLTIGSFRYIDIGAFRKPENRLYIEQVIY